MSNFLQTADGLKSLDHEKEGLKMTVGNAIRGQRPSTTFFTDYLFGPAVCVTSDFAHILLSVPHSGCNIRRGFTLKSPYTVTAILLSLTWE